MVANCSTAKLYRINFWWQLLRVHFLNVGHGDCTIIEHPSGRLTMIDVNNSQDYDPESLEELKAERRIRQNVNAFATAFGYSGFGYPGQPTLGEFIGEILETQKAAQA